MTAALDPEPTGAPGGEPGRPAGGLEAPEVQRRLPSTVYVLAGLLMLKALAIGLALLGLSFEPLRLVARSTVTYQLIDALLGSPISMAGVGLIALALLFAGLALLRRRRIGWLLAMVLTGVFVALDIWAFLTTGANHFWMLVNIITVFYLNQAEVRETVGAIEREPDPARVVMV